MTQGAVRFAVNNAAVFNPRELFIGNTDGLWYDPSDRSTLFQTSTGTTEIAASGDPVGYLVDKSGRSHDGVRRGADANRPTWVAATDGRQYLSFVVATNSGFTPGNAATGIFQNCGYGTFVAGFQFTALQVGTDQRIVFVSALVNTTSRALLYQPNASANYTMVGRRLDADGGVTLNASPAPVAGEDMVVLAEFNWEDQDGHFISQRGQASNATGFPSATAGVTSNTASGDICIGNGSVGGAALGGRLYGVIVLNRILTQGEKQKALRWMSTKTMGRFN